MQFYRPPLGEVITLSSGTSRVDVAPSCGARLLAFSVDGRDILRPAGDRAKRDRAPYDFAAFPLLPYSGPIFGGGFRHGGRFRPLGRNLAAEGDAVHGEAWLREWTVVERRADTLTLALDYEPSDGAYPFAWYGEIVFRLTPDTLAVAISLRNSEAHTIPAGMGFHPYFVREAGTRLSFVHGDVWPPDSPEALTVGPRVLEGLDFNAGLDLTGLVADRCFEDWPGTAALDYPDGRRVTLTASPSFGKLQLYVPWYDPYVCVEPVTNANDGFNRANAAVRRHGVVYLDPGATLRGDLAIRTEARNV